MHIFLASLRDARSSRVVPEAQRECGALWGFDKCLQARIGLACFFGFVWGDVGELFSVLSICKDRKNGLFWQQKHVGAFCFFGLLLMLLTTALGTD